MIDIEFASNSSNFTVGSFAIGYNLLENVSGLGQTVKNYHDQNSNNGQIDIVNIPIFGQQMPAVLRLMVEFTMKI